MLLPALAARLRSAAPGVTLRIVPSGAPSAELLRSDACQLVISPRPPDGTDIVQKRLLEDQYRVFYDARRAQRSAVTEAEYLAADHATVAYEARRGLELDQPAGGARRASSHGGACAGLCGPARVRAGDCAAHYRAVAEGLHCIGRRWRSVPVPVAVPQPCPCT